MKTEDLKYDDKTIIVAKYVIEDCSFAHEFGTEIQEQLVVEEINVVTYIGNIDYDITKALSDKQLDYFIEWAQEKLTKMEEVIWFIKEWFQETYLMSQNF